MQEHLVKNNFQNGSQTRNNNKRLSFLFVRSLTTTRFGPGASFELFISINTALIIVLVMIVTYHIHPYKFGFKEVLMDASDGVTLRQPCSGQIENQGVSIFVHNIPVIFDDKNVTIDGSEISDQPWMLGGNWTSKETEELVEDTKKMAINNDLDFDAGIGFYPTVAACVAVLVTLVSAGVLLGASPRMHSWRSCRSRACAKHLVA